MTGAASSPPVLVLPGYGDSGPQHWQSLWEAADPRWRRVQQRDWFEPRLDDWVDALERQVSLCVAPPVLVAHSLGCVLVAHWIQRTTRRAAAALLVAPADVDALAMVLTTVETFSPIPLVRLPFPSIVVASDDDPYATRERSEAFARAWGSRFVAVGRAGHLNTDSGHGEWPAGRALLEELLRDAAPGS